MVRFLGVGSSITMWAKNELQMKLPENAVITPEGFSGEIKTRRSRGKKIGLF